MIDTIYKILKLLKESPELQPFAYGLIFVVLGVMSFLIARVIINFVSDRSIRKEVRVQSKSIQKIENYFNRIEVLVNQLNTKVFNLLAKRLKK